jgi:hypothetical protein
MSGFSLQTAPARQIPRQPREVSFHKRRVADNEFRHEAKERIGNFANLRD